MYVNMPVVIVHRSQFSYMYIYECTIVVRDFTQQYMYNMIAYICNICEYLCICVYIYVRIYDNHEM